MASDYQTPDELAAMTDEELDAYFRSIGLYDRIAAALNEDDGSTHPVETLP